MFNSLNGQITFKDSEQLFLETGGVEWDLHISHFTSQALGNPGEQARVFTYLYHREDKVALFGFAASEERDLFLNLIKVEGIGPALGLKILSGIRVEDFITALDTENLALLTTVPGLGKKTAQKIIFKLRGKLGQVSKADPLFDDILAALSGMGFENRKAREALDRIYREVKSSGRTGAELEKELLKQAIAILGGG